MGSLSILVAAAALSLTPSNDVAADSVDLIEVNHFYDEHGRLVFDQVIFYDWCTSQNRYQVRAWRLLKKPSQIPYRNVNTGEYETTWHDGDVLRQVRGMSFRESWTQYDPELREREYLPKDRRSELYKTRVVSDSSR
jgi:hypothetical protein